MSQKVEKVHNFLDPSLPQDVLDFFEFGKIGNLMTPPLGPNLGKTWNWKNVEFWEPPLNKRNTSLRHLKLPKNNFKPNLFFVQLKHLKSTFTFGKNGERNKTWKWFSISRWGPGDRYLFILSAVLTHFFMAVLTDWKYIWLIWSKLA